MIIPVVTHTTSIPTLPISRLPWRAAMTLDRHMIFSITLLRTACCIILLAPWHPSTLQAMESKMWPESRVPISAQRWEQRRPCISRHLFTTHFGTSDVSPFPPSISLVMRLTSCKAEIESQESYNEDTALSEPISPPLEGFPNVHDFDLLIKRLWSLSGGNLLISLTGSVWTAM